MSWARLDDQAWNNERLLSLTPEARLLWFVGLSFVASEWPAGGGDIGASRAVALARMHGVDECFVKQLREAGRWEALAEGGFHVHHVEFYMQLAPAEAGRLGGLASAQSRLKTRGTAKPLREAASEAFPKQGLTRIPIPLPVTRVKSPNGESSSRKRESDMTVSLVEFTEAWNASCDPLPRLKKPPVGVAKERAVRQALTYFDGDLELLGAAIKRAAADEFYVSQHYSFETFCRHPERWGNESIPSNPSTVDPGEHYTGPTPLARQYW